MKIDRYKPWQTLLSGLWGISKSNCFKLFDQHNKLQGHPRQRRRPLFLRETQHPDPYFKSRPGCLTAAVLELLTHKNRVSGPKFLSCSRASNTCKFAQGPGTDQGLPWKLTSKESSCNAGEGDSIPGSGKSPEEGNGNALQYSCLENPTDGGAWQATVHGVTKSQTWLKGLSMHARGHPKDLNPFISNQKRI